MFRSTVPKFCRVHISRPCYGTSLNTRRSIPASSFSTNNAIFEHAKRKYPLTPLPGVLLRCPKCSIVLPTPLPACPNCFYIQRLDNTVPYHDLFQLPFEPNPFVVDTYQLKRRYLEAQKVCHPDGWATHGEESRKMAEGLSNYIGGAWSTLRDPLPRAEYILKLNGIKIAEEDQLEDLELISEIMEVREELENATPSKIQRIADENRDQILKTCEDIEKFVGEKDWEKAKKATIRLKYLDGIQRAASEWRPASSTRF